MEVILLPFPLNHRENKDKECSNLWPLEKAPTNHLSAFTALI